MEPHNRRFSNTATTQPHEKKNKIYFIPELLKPTDGSAHQKVDPKDPFISSEVLDIYCGSLFNPLRPPMQHAGLDTPQTLGPDFFKDAIKIQQERMSKALAAEAVERKAHEESEKTQSIAKSQIDEKISSIFTAKRVSLKRSCPVKIPYKSQLTHEEHAMYLHAYLKNQTGPLEKHEYQNYLNLQSRVLEEQNSLMEFSKKVAMLRLKDYNAVPPVIEEYIARYLKVAFARVLEYPRLYHIEQEIPLRPQDPHNVYAGLGFQHEGHLLSLGVVPWMKLPYPHLRIAFPNDDKFLAKFPPEDPLAGTGAAKRRFKPGATTLNKTTVSNDSNCEYLAVKHHAAIVITPSALRVLVDNPAPNFDKEWDIPVVIRSFPVDEGDSTVQHRVVFIDKPIKKKLWTPLEKKHLFFKKSGLTAVSMYRPDQLFKMKAPLEFTMSIYNKSNVDYQACGFNYDDNNTSRHQMKHAHANNSRGNARNIEEDTNSDSIFDDPFGPLTSVEEVDIFDNNDRNSSFNRKRKDLTPNTERKTFDVNEDNSNSHSKSSPKRMREDGNTTKTGASSPLKKTAENSEASAETSKAVNANSTQKVMWKSRRVGDPMSRELPGRNKKPWDLKIKTNWEHHSKIMAPPTSTTINYHYHLFKLERGGGASTSGGTSGVTEKGVASDNMERGGASGVMGGAPGAMGGAMGGVNGPPPITVLVRNHLHGLSLEKTRHSVKINRSSSYVLFPKLENQVFFGCEQNTHSEMVHQWAQLALRPNSQILQARICSETGELLLAEERDITEVLREGAQPHINMKKDPLLTSLYVIFNTLQRQPPGHYLLHHPNRADTFIKLMKKIDDTSEAGLQTVFDLHKSYGYFDPSAEPNFVMDDRKYTQPPWVAIDTLVPTPFHLQHRKIPGTFPMANPDKKLTTAMKKRVKEKAKSKKSIFDDTKTNAAPKDENVFSYDDN